MSRMLSVSGFHPTQRGPFRLLEAALWLLAIACFSSLAVVGVLAWSANHQAQTFPETPVPATASASISASTSPPATLQLMGRLEIPALHLSVPIAYGIETKSLLRGVGHVNGTALPGGLGTVVLAGHRDTYLRPLAHVAKGMKILLVGSNGAYRYTVDRWEIVTPEHVEVIATQSRPELALITCYPFYYIGPAPRRFVVHAHLESVAPQLSPGTIKARSFRP
jgi:sortase A